LFEALGERAHGAPAGLEQLADLGVAHRVVVLPPALDLPQPVLQRLDQQSAALRVLEQVSR